MRFLDLKKYLTNTVDNCYFLFGDDAYLLQNAIQQFFLKVTLPDINLVRLHSPTVAQLIDECNGMPFGSDFKLVIAKNMTLKSRAKSTSTKVTSKKNLKDKDIELNIFLDYLSKPNKTTILLLVDCDVSSDVILKCIEIDCNKLDTDKLIAWVQRQCIQSNCKIELDTAKILIDYCDNSLQRISLELDKLSAFKKDETITQEDVSLLVRPDVNFKIFELSQAVAQKDRDRAMQILQYCLINGEEPVALLGLLYAHFRRLACVVLGQNDANIRLHLGLKDYAVAALKRQATLFSARQLRKILSIFWQMDQDFRAGKFSLDWAVQHCMLCIFNQV
ncbi:MAG: DNA polymerase III subunit delta [Clostridiales bacterium]|jgi:DNA polymerase-3 subunit delta|nr:DNA polymerase III subunit delta [Clostridiales bacterium]